MNTYEKKEHPKISLGIEVRDYEFGYERGMKRRTKEEIAELIKEVNGDTIDGGNDNDITATFK